MECLHGQTVKALANHFGGPGSIPTPAVVRGMEPGCEIFVPDAALNGCELHVKPDFNFFLIYNDFAYGTTFCCRKCLVYTPFSISSVFFQFFCGGTLFWSGHSSSYGIFQWCKCVYICMVSGYVVSSVYLCRNRVLVRFVDTASISLCAMMLLNTV